MFKTNEEYLAAAQRYFDWVRDRGDYTPSHETDCSYVSCTGCMYHGSNSCPELHTFEMLEKLEEWVKEHPMVTYADKYKEVFGVDMSDRCPELPLGIKCPTVTMTCEMCKKKYWGAEYKNPNAE